MTYQHFTSDSGSFTCDESGRLLAFDASGQSQPVHSPILRHLYIPEGVRWIGAPADASFMEKALNFRDLTIMGDVTLPSTLEGLGHHAFFGCAMLSLTIPDALRYMGAGVLMHSYIRTLTLKARPVRHHSADADDAPGTLSVFGRDFKESDIDRLVILPSKREIPDNWLNLLMPEARILEIVRA